jgi:hypothetical protein
LLDLAVNRFPLVTSDVALELRSLRSPIITRFVATTNLSGSDPRGSPVAWACAKALRWVSRVDASILCAHTAAITPVLPEDAFHALFSSGLRSSTRSDDLDRYIGLFEACSAFIFIVVCTLADSLDDPFGENRALQIVEVSAQEFSLSHTLSIL